MAALAELEEAFADGLGRSAVRERIPPVAARVRRSPEPALRGGPPLRAAGNADPPQARGPQPHRCAQDQQHHRPGIAGRPHGQAAHHRRNRCRPARGCQRYRRRRPRPRMPGVHGGQGHGASVAQRRPDAAPRHRGDPGYERSRHPQRRRLRSDARLGRYRRDHPLHHRFGGRPSSVPAHGAGVPEGDRRRGCRAIGRPRARS